METENKTVQVGRRENENITDQNGRTGGKRRRLTLDEFSITGRIKDGDSKKHAILVPRSRVPSESSIEMESEDDEEHEDGEEEEDDEETCLNDLHDRMRLIESSLKRIENSSVAESTLTKLLIDRLDELNAGDDGIKRVSYVKAGGRLRKRYRCSICTKKIREDRFDAHIVDVHGIEDPVAFRENDPATFGSNRDDVQKKAEDEQRRNPNSKEIFTEGRFLFSQEVLLQLFYQHATSSQGGWFLKPDNTKYKSIERRAKYNRFNVKEFLGGIVACCGLKGVFTIQQLVDAIYEWLLDCEYLEKLRKECRWETRKMITLMQKFLSMSHFLSFLQIKFVKALSGEGKEVLRLLLPAFGKIANNLRRQAFADRRDSKLAGEVRYLTTNDIAAIRRNEDRAAVLSFLEDKNYLAKAKDMAKSNKSEFDAMMQKLAGYISLDILLSTGARPDSVPCLKIGEVLDARSGVQSRLVLVKVVDPTCRAKGSEVWVFLFTLYQYTLLERYSKLRLEVDGASREDYLFVTGDQKCRHADVSQLIKNETRLSEVDKSRLNSYDIRRTVATLTKKSTANPLVRACIARFQHHGLQMSEQTYNCEPLNAMSWSDIKLWDLKRSDLTGEQLLKSDIVAALAVEHSMFQNMGTRSLTTEEGTRIENKYLTTSVPSVNELVKWFSNSYSTDSIYEELNEMVANYESYFRRLGRIPEWNENNDWEAYFEDVNEDINEEYAGFFEPDVFNPVEHQSHISSSSVHK